MQQNKPKDQPFFNGDRAVVDWAFSNGIGGKKATVQDCFEQGGCESGWLVKIDLYPNPIDSNWLIKLPNQNEAGKL